MDSPSSSSETPCHLVTVSPKQKKTCRKFTLDDDIVLFTEVIAVEDAFSKPYSSPVWAGIVQKLVDLRNRMLGLTARAAKERAEKVVRQHKTKDNWRARQ